MDKRTAKKVNKLIDDISAITEKLTEIRDELQEKYDNMSEKRLESEAGERLEDEIGKLDDLIDNLEYADDARPEQEG